MLLQSLHGQQVHRLGGMAEHRVEGRQDPVQDGFQPLDGRAHPLGPAPGRHVRDQRRPSRRLTAHRLLRPGIRRGVAQHEVGQQRADPFEAGHQVSGSLRRRHEPRQQVVRQVILRREPQVTTGLILSGAGPEQAQASPGQAAQQALRVIRGDLAEPTADQRPVLRVRGGDELSKAARRRSGDSCTS